MLVIKNGTILRSENLKPEKANLAIEDGIIVEISKKNIPSDHKIDARGCIIAPGLINAHVHTSDSIIKDAGDGKPIDDLIKPPNGLKHRIIESASKKEIIEAIRGSILEMIATGTTTFIEYREGGVKGIKLFQKASKDLPINPIILGRDPIFLKNSATPDNVKKRVKRLLKICDGIGPSGLGEIGDENAHIIVEECEKRDKIASIHVAESLDVQGKSLKEKGKSEVKRAIEAGFHLLVHMTNPLPGDIKMVSKSTSSVVTCPRSNGMLSVGIPPIEKMHREGVNLLLGSDNVMFNAPDMFREMEYALKVTRAYNRRYFHPREILKMATVNIQRILKEKIGCLEVGFQADILITESLSKNPYLSLINRTQSKNIRYVIVKGRIVKR